MSDTDVEAVGTEAAHLAVGSRAQLDGGVVAVPDFAVGGVEPGTLRQQVVTTDTQLGRLDIAGAIVAAVAHKEYAEMGVAKLCDKLVPNGVFTDVKSFYDQFLESDQRQLVSNCK